MKKITIFFFLFCSLYLYSQDQEATLFFRDGTSLKGYASIKDNWIIQFRLTLEDDPDEWKDIMAKAITFHGFDTDIMCEYQYLKADLSYPLLLEVIEKGNVNLYKTIDYYTETWRKMSPNDDWWYQRYYIEVSKKNKNHYYIKKPEQELVTKLNNSFYNKEATKFFEDCTSLVSKINSEKYTKKRAIKIVEFYNDLCDDEIFVED